MADIASFSTPGGGRYAVISWKDVNVRVAIKPAEPFSATRIYGCEKFKELVKDGSLKIPALKSESLDELLLKLGDLIAMRIDSSRQNSQVNESELSASSKILYDLSAIGWQNIIKADHKSGQFIFKLDEKHGLNCTAVNGSYKCSIEPPLGDFRDKTFPSLAAAYCEASVQFNTLSDYHMFIAQCKNFFHVNEIGDGQIEVLKSSGRWILLKFDPSDLRAKPLAEGLDLTWDTTIDSIENMKRNFPSSSAMGSLECGVCSSTKDSNGSWPDYHCSSNNCNQPFHRACLLEWFLADPRSIKSFGQTHGSCPFCEHVNVLEM